MPLKFVTLWLNGKMVRLIKRRNSIIIGVTIVFSLSFCFSLRAQSSEIVGVGDKIPNFEFVLDGVKLDESYFTHKLVWINFFATWCPPCRAELKLINEKLYKKYKDNCDFAFIAVGYGHDIEQIRLFQIENQLELPFVADQNLSIFSLFAKGVIPRNYLVDREGVIFYAGDGFDEAEFEKLFELVDNELHD